MNRSEIEEMLCVMSDMTKSILNGTTFVEISTYVRNHVPGIEPKYVEVFRDVLCPLQNQQKEAKSLSNWGLKYNEVTGEFEEL